MKNYILPFLIIFLILSCAQENNVQKVKELSPSTPEAEGISSSAILEFISRTEAEIDAMHSFILLRHGRLISQGWWDPYGPETPHVMHSLSKSFTSTAVGFAVQEGLFSLDDLVISFFPDKAPEEPTWHWNEMRVRDLLTMNTGHLQEPRGARDSDDWVKFFLESKVELLPGTVFRYNSMATYMLSAIIQKVTGEKLVDYLDPRLFQPLKIKKPEWDEDPMGINVGGWGLRVVTEDIAKLGQLYLQKGVWEGKQLLSREWVEMATSKQVSNGSNPDNDWAQGYGFQFWRCRHNCYRGDGALSQFCIVMPDQDAVLAITSGAHDMARVMNIVWETLLPAMKDQPLPANEEVLLALKTKTGNLKLKPVVGESSSPVGESISGKKFIVKGNQDGVKAISFDFESEDHQISIEMDHGTETVQIGTSGYTKGKLNSHIPFTNNMLRSVAASGGWTDTNEYTVRIYLYETPARITYTFSIDNDELVWESNLDHALFGRRDIPLLKASAK